MIHKPFVTPINLSPLNELLLEKYFSAEDLEVLKDLSNYYKFAVRCPSCGKLFGLDKMSKNMSPFCPECLVNHNYKNSIITKLRGMKGGFRLNEENEKSDLDNSLE